MTFLCKLTISRLSISAMLLTSIFAVFSLDPHNSFLKIHKFRRNNLLEVQSCSEAKAEDNSRTAERHTAAD